MIVLSSTEQPCFSTRIATFDECIHGQSPCPFSFLAKEEQRVIITMGFVTKQKRDSIVRLKLPIRGSCDPSTMLQKIHESLRHRSRSILLYRAKSINTTLRQVRLPQLRVSERERLQTYAVQHVS